LEAGVESVADDVGSILLDCHFATAAVTFPALLVFASVFTFSGTAWGDGF
jgi:hypothetical protein